jgi:putative hemin transport protein
METALENNAVSLLAAWKELQKERPHLRIRDAAEQLGVSEVQLLATRIGDGVVRLDGSWPELLLRFKQLGHVMSLTRNDSCVLEHKGTFQEIDIMGEGARAMATVIGPIESRVFFSGWHTAYAVTDVKQDKVLKSIQIFDKAGDAVTKIYLQEKSNEEAYQQILADFRAKDQTDQISVERYPTEALSAPENRGLFLEEWSNLKDTHDFFGMLRKHKTHRYVALEVAKGQFTYQIDPNGIKTVLEESASSKLPIMIFVGNKGNIQIHQEKIQTIRELNQGQYWLNILDPAFNMHLLMDSIETAWVVKKPTSEGNVTSIELFDKQKNLAVQFFGLRKPGIPEKQAWRTLVESLPAR